MQFHDAAVDKADHHHGGSAGTLDHSGNAQAKEKTLEGVIGQLAQDLLQLAAGLLFQGLAHDVHAEQKQGKAAKQGKDIENGHKDFLTFDFRSCFHPQRTPLEQRRSAYRKSILRVLMVLSCLRVYCCNVKSKIRGM